MNVPFKENVLPEPESTDFVEDQCAQLKLRQGRMLLKQGCGSLMVTGRFPLGPSECVSIVLRDETVFPGGSEVIGHITPTTFCILSSCESILATFRKQPGVLRWRDITLPPFFLGS